MTFFENIYESIAAQQRWDLFHDLSFEEKVARLSTSPYSEDKYYHVSPKEHMSSILKMGLTGDEIWVTKGKPWKEYQSGVLFELDLRGYELFDDVRWKTESGVKISTEPIPASKITKTFMWLDKINKREDILAAQGAGRPDKVAELVKRYGL